MTPSLSRVRLRASLVVLGLLALSLWGSLRLNVVSDIRHFIPSELGRDLSGVSGALAGSSLTRTSVLAIEGSQAPQAAGALADHLAAQPEIEWVQRGVDATVEQTLRELYLPRRFYLSRPSLAENDLQRAAAELKRTLGGPKGPLLRQLAPSDPLMSFTGFLEEIRKGEGARLTSREGQFIATDGSAAVLFVRTHASAFDSSAQAHVQALLEEGMAVVHESYPNAKLSQSGLARFAISAEHSTKADVTRVSVASTVAIIVVFLLFFGRVRPIVLTFAPVALGVGGGIIGCSLLTSQVHGLTLAFGSALLGVGVDYAVHLMFHLGHRGQRTSAEVIARVRPGLLLGAGTTVVGLAGLALTSFPGMRELALFGTVGVAGSLVVTLLVVPAFAGDLPPSRVREWLLRVCQALLRALERWGKRVWLMFAAVLLLCGTGIASLEWSDGLRALYQVDETLLQEDMSVRELTGAVDLSRMVLATGDDLQQALERNGAVHAIVQDAAANEELDGYRSVQPWLPAVSWQQENLERLRAAPVRERFDRAFAAEGFRGGVFDAFFEELADPSAEPLELDDLQDTELWQVVEPFVLQLEDKVVVVTWLRGDVSAGARAQLDAIDGVVLFDQQAFLDGAYGRYRLEMIRMLAAGFFAVALLVFIRYRNFRATIAALLPALAGAMGAIGVAGWIGGTANLIHAASLLLVCSIGADYGVFMVESGTDEDERATTLAASILAGLTTMLSFGLLAMSDNPALASVGRSVVVGVLCALVTAPVACTLRPPKQS